MHPFPKRRSPSCSSQADPTTPLELAVWLNSPGSCRSPSFSATSQASSLLFSVLFGLKTIPVISASFCCPGCSFSGGRTVRCTQRCLVFLFPGPATLTLFCFSFSPSSAGLPHSEHGARHHHLEKKVNHPYQFGVSRKTSSTGLSCLSCHGSIGHVVGITFHLQSMSQGVRVIPATQLYTSCFHFTGGKQALKLEKDTCRKGS